MSGFIKYLIFIVFLIGIGFFILDKNLEYKELVKEEKKIIKRIYLAEEERRYALYEIEKLKKEKKFIQNFDQILIFQIEDLPEEKKEN